MTMDIDLLRKYAGNLCLSICPHGAEQSWPHDPACQVFHQAAAEILSLRARVAELEARVEIAEGLNGCACGYDNPTDICLGHLKILEARATRTKGTPDAN